MGDDNQGKKPFRPTITAENAKERGRAGGIKSGQSRRRKADIRRALKDVLSLDVPDGATKEKLEELGLDPNMGYGLALSVIMKAIHRGDYKALATIAKLADQSKSLDDRREQKARTDKAKAEAERVQLETKQMSGEDVTDMPDDGFIDALEGAAAGLWDDD